MSIIYLDKLSQQDIYAINNWHWPVSNNGYLDIYAPVECTTDEMKEFRTSLFDRRFKHAINTYRKYINEADDSKRKCWIIETIANISKCDPSYLPKQLNKIGESCQRYLETTDEQELQTLRSRIFKVVDIYVSSIHQGRPKKCI